MPIFEIHIHNVVDLDGIQKSLNLIIKKLDTMALTLNQFKAALAEVSTALENIGEDITRLTTELQREDLTDAEEQEVFDELNAIAERAKALAARTPESETPAP